MTDINKTVHSELQEYAQLYFAAIIEANVDSIGVCRLSPGKYTASELIDKRKLSRGHYCCTPQDEMYDDDITIQAGDFSCTFPYRQIFAVLARWEAQMKAGKNKAVFEVGAVDERSVKVILKEKTAVGEYKTKRMKMRRVHGNWWAAAKDARRSGSVTLYYDLNGTVFSPGMQVYISGTVSDDSEVEKRLERIDDANMAKKLLGFIACNPQNENCSFYAEVARRAGIDMDDDEARAIAEAAHQEALRREDGRRREEAEEQARRLKREVEERQQVEEEERCKATVLAEGKEKLLKHERITVEQIGLIAEAVGYKINIRTIGFMREKVTEAVLRENDTVTVRGRKLTNRNIDGTANVMRELYNRLKAQAEDSTTQATETPQIPTKTVGTANVSVEGVNTAERTENKPISINGTQATKNGLVKNKAAELDVTLYICQRLVLYAVPSPPSPETPRPPRRESPPKWLCRAIGHNRLHRRRKHVTCNCKTVCAAPSTTLQHIAPRGRSTANSPPRLIYVRPLNPKNIDYICITLKTQKQCSLKKTSSKPSL